MDKLMTIVELQF